MLPISFVYLKEGGEGEEGGEGGASCGRVCVGGQVPDGRLLDILGHSARAGCRAASAAQGNSERGPVTGGVCVCIGVAEGGVVDARTAGLR